MPVNLVLVAIGAVFSFCILAATVWALTRADDRIQMATACLFLSSLGYTAVAAVLLSKGDDNVLFGVLVGVYALSLYLVMVVLAIWSKHWAWQASVAAFGLQLLIGIVDAGNAFGYGVVGIGALLLWLSVAAVGLWACLHPGSRQVVGALSSGTG